MWGGICQSYSKGRRFGISHILLEEFGKRITDAGYDETKRNVKHLGYKINLWQDAHSSEGGPDLLMNPRSIMVKSYKWVEYYFSFPADAIMRSGDPLHAWLAILIEAVHMIEKKSGIIFLALENDKFFIDELTKEFRSNDKYKFDRFRVGGMQATDVIL